MLRLELLRDIASPECTLGVLTFGAKKCFTIERPWLPDPLCKSGVKYRSCVSDGLYRLERHSSEKFGNVWALVNPALDVYHWPADVPPGRAESTRTVILLHAGNYVHDVIGCIAPGKNRARRGREWVVERSRDALNEVRAYLGAHVDLWIDIRWATPPK